MPARLRQVGWVRPFEPRLLCGQCRRDVYGGLWAPGVPYYTHDEVPVLAEGARVTTDLRPAPPAEPTRRRAVSGANRR